MGWFLFALSLLVLVLACIKIERLQERLRTERRINISSLVDAIAQHVSDAHGAAVLREAAKRWESPLEQAYLRQLADRKYVPGGPSMPSIWLNDCADLMDPATRPTGETSVR